MSPVSAREQPPSDRPLLSRASLVIARTEFRRTLRIVAGDRTKALMLGALAVFMLGPIMLFGTLLLSSAGESVAAGNVDAFGFATATEIATGLSALLWLGIVLMATIRTTTAVADLDKPACLLISTSLRNIVVGLISAEILRFGVWVIVPVLVLSGAFAYGAGTIWPAIVAPAVVLVLLASAIPVGFCIGIWARHLLTVYEPVARYRTHLIILLAGLYFGAITMGWVDTLTATLFGVLGDSPLGWPGHLLVVGVPNVSASTTGVIGALVGTAVVVPLTVGVGIVSARIHWGSDPARSDDDGQAGETSSSDRLTAVLARGFDLPVRTVAVTAIRRSKRSPVRLLYAAYPLFGAFFFLQDVVQTGVLPSYAAVLFAMYVVWGAGALFTLNLLGDLGRALPAVMTSTISGRQAVTGGVVAGAVVAIPLAILVPIVVGFASPLSLEQTGLLVAGTVVGALVTPALAAGVGTAFPRFGSVRITNNSEAVMPSKSAFVVYSLVIAFPAVAALVLYADAAPDLIASLLSALVSLLPRIDLALEISANAITAVAWAVLVAGLLAPVLSYRYAVSRFDGYRLE